jgi:GTPase SAR1 family protein
VGSGKSSILRHLVEYTYDASGMAFGSKILNAKGRNIKLQLWDYSGEESFLPITAYYAQAFIVTCDLSQEDGLEKTRNYWKGIKRNIPSNCRVFLIGTKADLTQKITIEKLEDLAKQMDTPHSVICGVTSAKEPASGQKVSELFEEVINNVVHSVIQKPKTPASSNKPYPSATAPHAGMFSKANNLQKAVSAFFRVLGEFMFYCFAEEIGNSHITKPRARG